MVIKVSDFIAKFCVEKNIQHVFMMVGGGAMHLNNSLGKCPELSVIFNHHEQACAIAAESYARLTNKIPLVNVTTGPGGLNTLTGVFGAWTDSIPMFVISGQVRYDTTVEGSQLPLRQMGDQECEIVKIVNPITKYAVMVTSPEMIQYHLEKAFYLAHHGRPGPVWLDIPMNVQGAMVDEDDLIHWSPDDDQDIPEMPEISVKTIQEIIWRIQQAKRPVILAGTGVRLSGAYQDFLKLIKQLKIPVVTAWNAHDLLSNNHPYYAGRPGTVGDRAGNFVVQNADLLLVLGSRLNIRQIGYNWQTFARDAYKIMIDIDPLEMEKPTLNIDLKVHGDLKTFCSIMLKELVNKTINEKKEWLDWCRRRKEKYPVVLDEYWKRDRLINPYCFMGALSDQLQEEQIVVAGNGSACVMAFQALEIKKGQRLYTNSGCASMGYGLPAAIGACVGSGKSKVICLTGEGSLQLNLQELAVIAYHQYPIKIFVLNNEGYHSIRQTQHNFFGEPLVGCDPETGVSFPNLQKLADAYGLSYFSCDHHTELENSIKKTLAGKNPAVCELFLTIEQPFAPKASSKQLSNRKIVSRPLEDMAPFLDKKEFEENMIIEPIPEI